MLTVIGLAIGNRLDLHVLGLVGSGWVEQDSLVRLTPAVLLEQRDGVRWRTAALTCRELGRRRADGLGTTAELEGLGVVLDGRR